MRIVLFFAECIIYSVDFDKFRTFNLNHQWNETAKLLTDAATNLQFAGADAILLCANTAHRVAGEVQEAINIPLIDIRDATIKAIHQQGLKRVGLLGTVFTMEMEFYREKFTAAGIETIIPQHKTDRDYIEDTLLHELGKGIIRLTTKAAYLKIIDELIAKGAEGIILGCTEIPLLISEDDLSIPSFNTTKIHVLAAVDFALS
ncbi:MAG: amino acid racemase [Pedobacter sp.]|nr:MAG: amino acid racemase [Pedobacter sp.]